MASVVPLENTSPAENDDYQEDDYIFQARNDTILPVGESRKKTADDLTDEDMTDLMIATTLVQDAVNRRCIEINEDKDSFVAWRNYNNPGLLFLHQLCLLIMFLLLLVEDPAVKRLDVEPYYYIPLSVEVLILLFFCFRLDQLRRSQGYEKWKNPKNLIFSLAIALTFVDITVYVILREVEGVSVRPNPDGLERREIFRFMRALRPIFIICSEEKESMRRAVTNIWKTIPDILSVLLLLICSILLFALMALKLFGERDMTQYGAPSYYFKDYWNSFFDLYVLMTTANSPDVFMPAYNDSDGWMIFFMIFIILDTYIFMNLFLAVIYNNYKNNVKSDVENILGMKEYKLRRAFRIFQRVFGQVDYSMFKWLMEQTSNDSKNIIAARWLILSDGSEILEEEEFLTIAELLSITILEKNPGASFSLVEQFFPRFYNSTFSIWFIRLCKDEPYKKWFQRFFDLAILVNAICIGLDQYKAEYFFLSLFCFEIFWRIYAYGSGEYFSIHRLWNWFDFLIILATVIATIFTGIGPVADEPRNAALDILLILRCLRLIRIFNSVPSFRIILLTIRNILPSLGTYCVIIVCLYTVFAIVGMEAFQGLIRADQKHNTEDGRLEYKCGNPDLENDDFVKANYCKNNFNDFISAFVTLFELTVVNQWHIITRGYVKVTNGGAFVYFILFHMLQVLLVMNIVVAFTLEAFLLEYESQKTNLESRTARMIKKYGMESKKGISTTIFDRETDEIASSVQLKLVRGMTGIDDLLERMFNEGQIQLSEKKEVVSRTSFLSDRSLAFSDGEYKHPPV